MTVFKFKAFYLNPQFDSRVGIAVVDIPEVNGDEAPVAIVSRNTPRVEMPYRWYDDKLWVPTRRPGGRSDGLSNAEIKDVDLDDVKRVDKVDIVEMSDAFTASEAWSKIEARAENSLLIGGEAYTRTPGPTLLLERMREGNRFRWTDSPIHPWGSYPRINAFTYREAALGRSIGNASSGRELVTLGEDPSILMDVDDGYRSLDAAIESGCWFAMDAVKKRRVEDLSPEAIEAMVRIRQVLSERMPDVKYNASSTHFSMNGARGFDVPDASALVEPLSTLVTFLRPGVASWAKVIVDTLSERISQTPHDLTNDEALSLAFS